MKAKQIIETWIVCLIVAVVLLAVAWLGGAIIASGLNVILAGLGVGVTITTKMAFAGILVAYVFKSLMSLDF